MIRSFALSTLAFALPTASAIVIDAKTFMPKLLNLLRGSRHSDEDLREMMFRLVLSSTVDFFSR